MGDRAALPGPGFQMQVGACLIGGQFFDLAGDELIDLGTARGLLNQAERARADRFHFDRHREFFTRGRGFLRQTISRLLGLADAAALEILEGANGKPMLAGDPIWFNLSHSEADAVLIWSHDGPLGVDLERHDRQLDVRKLARSVFTTTECDVLDGAPDEQTRQALFFDFWTAKEARMKVTGEGMQLNPKDISLVLEAGMPVGFAAPQSPKVALRYVSHLDGLSCAVVA